MCYKSYVFCFIGTQIDLLESDIALKEHYRVTVFLHTIHMTDTYNKGHPFSA